MKFAFAQMPSPDRLRSSRQVVSIQYLRALAAFAVVASHTHPIVSFGQCGVDVFFVISGYIMWMIARANPSPIAFVLARVTRIVPLYWIATTIMGVHQHASMQAILKSMFFIPFIGEQEQIWPVLVQGWTLNYEMYFYLIVALSLFIPAKWRLGILVLALVGFSIIGAFGKFDNPVIKTYTNPLLLEFCFGILLCAFGDRSTINPLVASALLVAGLVLDIVLPQPELLGLSRVITWGIPGALIVAGAVGYEATRTVPRLGTMLLLGEASFAVYLFHPFVLKTIMQSLSAQPPLAGTLGVITVSTGLGIVTTLFLERPILSLMRRATLPARL